MPTETKIRSDLNYGGSSQLDFLGWTAYALATLFIVLPLADITLGLLPVQLGNMRWRIGAAGLATGALLLPLLGVFMMLAVSHIQHHRRMQYVIATGTALGVLLLVAVIVLFTLDTLQLRGEIDPERQHLYDRAALKGIIAQLLTIVVLAIMSFGSWRAIRTNVRRERMRKREGDMLVARATD